jgi:hypothetical protein
MHKICFRLAVFLLLISCTSSQKKEEYAAKIFNQLTPKQTGISFANNLIETDSLNYLSYAYMYMGGGIAAGDFNNDGLNDLFFTGNMVANKLYLNKGGLKFEDISKQAGVEGDSRWFTGVTTADVNGDGYLDIYCSVGGKFKPKNNLLYINNGDMTFTERAEEYGIDDIGNSVQATFFDYDLDGDLDLYVANYPPTPFNAPNQFYQFKMYNTKDIETDKLYRNDGGKFTNVTDEAGLRSFGLSLSVTVSDLNQDGWPDIYVSNDFSTPDYLYINNGDGTFKEQVKEATDQISFYGMGVDIADYNNDGLLDIFQVDMDAPNNRRAKANMASMNPQLFWGTVNSGFHYQYMHNCLQLNTGNIINNTPTFSNVSRLSGVSSTDWSWGPLFADLDNDGWKDLFITNGIRREVNNRDYFKMLEGVKNLNDSLLERTLQIPSEKIDNYVFRNKGDLTFEKMNQKWGISFKGFSNGAVYVDLDNDGDLEIVVNNIDDYASIFENKSSEINNFIILKLNGTHMNRFGLGAKVEIESEGITQIQELTLTRGYQSSVAPELHFGLGKSELINQLTITWPDGNVQILNNIVANQILQLKHEESIPVKMIVKDQKRLFVNVTEQLGLKHKHSENLYDDFIKEVLLPHRTSTFGPYLSIGDLNNDNMEDFFISGASQYKSGLYFQTSEGFEQQHTILDEDNKYEDMGSLMFDADNDGDLDLYVVSGGNEFDAGSEMLQDRLFLNDGSGNLTRAIGALPIMLTSGSRVYNADFDNDGDMDLFVCGRLVPGNYPAPARSYILENKSTPDNILFVDVTEDISPELFKPGLVTAASWSDYNNDGWVDLIVTGEWMPIRVFQNINGKLKETSKKMGLDKSTGWWFSIANGDFDNDGDLDFVLGNLGLNYKYKSTDGKTFDIYLNDFDKNNSNDIVLSYYSEGEKYPVRGRECSSQQIPAIKNKFKNFETYSNASLIDIYTEKDLKESLHYQVNTFSSVYMENKGDKFILHKLPNMAQLSSTNQIIPFDFDDDGNLDFIMAGNLYASEVETPRNDAGKGLFMKGDGHGNFKAIPYVNSGLYTAKDVKDLAMITIKGKRMILVANNDTYIEVVKFN